MSLEQAIQTRWAGDAALIALVPAARFVTGKMLSGATLPYATLSRRGLGKTTRTSSHKVDEVRVQIDVWTESLETGKQVADAVQALLDGQSFSEAGVNVLRMRRVDAAEALADDGSWRLSLEYLAKVES